MGGTAEEVRPEVHRRPLLVALLLTFILLPPVLRARDNGDFLVIEHAGRLVVYNKYQQQATEAERKFFTPFAPIRILKSDGLLADGFTRCMRVELWGETFFLLKDKGGKLTRSGPLGFEQTFRNTAILLDTVQILAGQSVRLTPINSAPVYLAQGEKVVRIFRYLNAAYCARPGPSPEYGWAGIAGKGVGRIWKTTAASGSLRTSIPVPLVEQVEMRVGEVNRLLARLFEHFNNESHQQKEIPHWTIESTGTAITCTLRGAGRSDRFERSTLYLVKDIENIVLGANLEVSSTPDIIHIRRP